MVSTGASKPTCTADRVNALCSAFNAGCSVARLLALADAPGTRYGEYEDDYKADIEKRFGLKTKMYRACLKAWLEGCITTTMVIE